MAEGLVGFPVNREVLGWIPALGIESKCAKVTQSGLPAWYDLCQRRQETRTSYSCTWSEGNMDVFQFLLSG